MKKLFFGVLVATAATVAMVDTVSAAEVTFRKPTKEERVLLNLPLGLNPRDALVPVDNPITREKIELGRALYFDHRLSKNDTIACATCHHPNMGFGDAQPVSLGIHAQKGGRSAPTVINRLFSKGQFWDGRVPSLEEQAKGPITNPIEMGMPNHDEAVAKLNAIPGYVAWFKKVFGTEVTLDGIAKAIATFERTVVSGNAPFDRYKNGDKKAMTASQVRGMELFEGKANCTQCHKGFNFTDERFHNLGVDWDKDKVDVGRYGVTKELGDIGAFKTPTLRDIANTGPYMHDGRHATLAQVVAFYDQGGIQNELLDETMGKKLNLTAQEKADLVAFMEALSGEGWQDKTAPASFPE